MSEPLPSISVLVRSAGRPPDFVRRATASIAAQTRAPAEVVVCNFGGSAVTIERVVRAADFPRSRVAVHHLPPLPQAAAANRAVELARCEWIAFLDDDDTWEPDFIARVSAVIARESRDPAFGGVITRTLAVYESADGDRICEHDREPFNPALSAVDLGLLMIENQFTNNALVFRRDAWVAIGPFREDLPALYDWEFNVRLAERYRIEVVPEMLARYHQRRALDSVPNTPRGDFERAARRLREEWSRRSSLIGAASWTLAHARLGVQRFIAQWRRWRYRVAHRRRRVDWKGPKEEQT